VDEVITFDPLTREELRQIVDLMLQDVYKAAADQSMTVTVEEPVKDYLAENGYDEQYGARPLRRLIQRSLEDEIAEAFLKGEVGEGSKVLVTMKDGKPSLVVEEK